MFAKRLLLLLYGPMAQSVAASHQWENSRLHADSQTTWTYPKDTAVFCDILCDKLQMEGIYDLV